MPNTGNGRRIALAGLVVGALALAACGGGSTHSASASTGATTTTIAADGAGRGAALASFSSCMGAHGITLSAAQLGRRNGPPPSTTPGETRPARPAGGFGGGLAARLATAPAGVDATKYAAAFATCKAKLPTGGGFLNNSAFQAYASCLRDHGVVLPGRAAAGATTPTTATTGTTFNRNDPKVVAAMKTCAPLLPAGGFRGATTTTTAPPA